MVLLLFGGGIFPNAALPLRYQINCFEAGIEMFSCNTVGTYYLPGIESFQLVLTVGIFFSMLFFPG